MLTQSNLSRQARRKQERDQAKALIKEEKAKERAAKKVLNSLSRIFRNESIDILLIKWGLKQENVN